MIAFAPKSVLRVCVLALCVSACGAEAGVGDENAPPSGQHDPVVIEHLADEPSQEPAREYHVTVVPPPAPDPALRMTAPKERWTWVDIPESRCANGSPTGVGVNLVDGSDDVVLFLQGGGACWDGLSCWGTPSAFYVATGYGRVEFATDAMRPAMLPLRRDDPNNPFRHANLVYVPYCTGDVHAGDKETSYSFLGFKHRTYHHGWKNVGLALERIAATFPRMKKLWLMGDSAGGFGSALNFDRVQQRFPSVRVDVLDDSGQPIAPLAGRWEKWRDAWNLQLPADCPGCRTDVSAMVDYYRVKYPQNRFGLVSFTNDSVITTFMALLPNVFYDELMALGSHMDQTWPNGHYYFIPGISHVGFATPTPGLIDWMKKFAADDPGWKSHALIGP